MGCIQLSRLGEGVRRIKNTLRGKWHAFRIHTAFRAIYAKGNSSVGYLFLVHLGVNDVCVIFIFWKNALHSLKLRGRSACASVLFILLPPNQQIENYHSSQKMKLEYICGTEIIHPSQHTACTFSPPLKSHQRLQVEVLYLLPWPFHPWNTIRDFLRLSMSFLFDHLREVYHRAPTSLALFRKD